MHMSGNDYSLVGKITVFLGTKVFCSYFFKIVKTSSDLN